MDLEEISELPFWTRFLIQMGLYCFLGWIVHKEPDAYQLVGFFAFFATIFIYSKEIRQGHW